MPPLVDHTGEEYIYFQVVGRHESDDRRGWWICKCVCGRNFLVRSDNLKTRVSCGCMSPPKHGKWRSLEYNTWDNMKQRCLNPHRESYPDYGGRGIKICERWLEFENFYEDMGPRPSPQYSLERLDNDGNYEPNNCVWATIEQQSRNKCNTRNFTVNNEILCAVDLAKKYNISLHIIYRMLKEGKNESEILERFKDQVTTA